ncbi:MAG: hypothetical protein K2H96_10450 [Muribaculaceae bacterium]|nr:hypothetical protein [Muribaculaceae bacterium]
MKIFTLTKMAAVSTFIALGGSALTVSAQTVDLGELEAGKEYSWPQYSTVKGTYTPKESGVAKFVYSTAPLALYSSPDHNENSEVFGSHSYSDLGQVKTYTDLEAGKTYYLYHGFVMDEGTLVIYEGSPEIQVSSTTPNVDPESPGYTGYFSASSNYEMLVSFNFPVNVGNVFIAKADDPKTRVQVAAKAGGSSVGCDVAPAIMTLYRNGSIGEGDEVMLSLYQVTDATDSSNKYNKNGKCDIKFKVAAKPLELVEVKGANRQSAANPFNSFYLPGDEEGLITFVFDGPLSTEKLSVASISYGNSDNLEVGVYTEDVTARHDDKNAIFDFSGKRRRPIDMLPESDKSTQPESLYISFGNIYSPDGQRAYTGSKSNPTGYPMSFMINVLQYTIAAEFTPARGTDLIFGNPMEIWVMNGAKISYDAIHFEYTENGEDKTYDIPREDVKEEKDPLDANAMLFTFTIPTLPCDAGTPVKVSMSGLQCADGLDHANDISAEYKQATSGITDASFSDSDALDVYDIAGVCVLSGVNRDALSSLAKGIYVVNGKKIVIR